MSPVDYIDLRAGGLCAPHIYGTVGLINCDPWQASMECQIKIPKNSNCRIWIIHLKQLYEGYKWTEILASHSPFCLHLCHGFDSNCVQSHE